MNPVDQSRNHVGRAATVALVAIVVLGPAVLATLRRASRRVLVGPADPAPTGEPAVSPEPAR